MSFATVLYVLGGVTFAVGVVGCYRGKQPVRALLVLAAGIAIVVIGARVEPGEDAGNFAESCTDRGGAIAYDGTVELPVSVPGRRGATSIEYETNYLYRCTVGGSTVDRLTTTARIAP